MKEWVTVIIVLLIVAILLDGVRRMRIAQRDKIRMSRSMYKNKGGNDASPKENFSSELPNGGARVIGSRGNAQAHPKNSKHNKADNAQKQTHLDLGEPVPLLMESVSEDVLLRDRPATYSEDARQTDVDAENYSRNSAFGSKKSSSSRDRTGYENDRIEPTFIEPTFSEAPTQRTEYSSASESTDSDISPDEGYGSIDEDRSSEYWHGEVDEDDYPEDGYPEDDYIGEDDDDEDFDEDDYADESSEQLQQEPDEVLIINIMAAKGQMFNGTQLLDALLKCGMRYGDMNIFHRYSDTKGEGALLFSMANMVKPGIFDLDTMDQFETPGVSLFMTLPLNADSMQSFDLMVDTAQTIAEKLDGELKDEQRSVMTRQTIEHSRQRIRDFELKRLSRSRQL